MKKFLCAVLGVMMVSTVFSATDTITIATTKYTETQFSPIDSALASAVAAVNTVVTNTINQAASIATLHANKQTRPADDSECPAGKKCLLVTDENNVPHWYEIVTSLLPSGYTRLEYVSNATSTYLDTGIIPTVDNIVMEIKVTPRTGSWYMWQSRATNAFGISGSTSGNTITLNPGSAQALTSNITRRSGDTVTVRATFLNGHQSLYVHDDITGESDTVTGERTFVLNGLPLFLFGNQTGNRVAAGTGVYYAKMYMNDELVMDYVPVRRDSDGVVGFYDFATNSFKVVNEGSLSAGPVVE